MEQLSFDSAPVLAQHATFSASGPDERIADLDTVRRLHRREFVPMNANDRDPGKVVTYRIKPSAQDAPIPAPAHQTIVASPEVRLALDSGTFSPDRMAVRVREQRAVNALVLSGGDVLNAL